MIKIDHLTMRFGKQAAVSDLCLNIEPGESVALWGTNGAGKSTVLRCVMGLLRYRGSVEIAGLDVRREGKRARQHIGYVPQELGFYDDLRVGAAVRYFGTLKGISPRDVDATLDRVGLLGHDKKRIRELSGGMKQRLALGLALINDPPILVLDEVTASLDACGRDEFISLLSTIFKSGAKRTMLFASHRPDEIQHLSGRVVTLNAGVVKSDESASAFAGKFRETMHLFMDSVTAHRSVQVLRSSGVDARLNGRGILVPVTPGDRAAPLEVLSKHSLRYHDLELLSSHTDGGEQ